MRNQYQQWQETSLPPIGGLSEVNHQYQEEAAYALLAAEGTGRPLLVQGEPGSGKSQLARYAAAVNKRRLVTTVITASTQADDLRWRCDNLARLSEAQMAAVPSSRFKRAEQRVKLERFITPGPLWWAYGYQSAKAQYEKCAFPVEQPPAIQEGLNEDADVVLLVDEIDKADSDLPNSLLDILANHDFDVPVLNTSVRQHKGSNPPLIIITSNNERDLPPAFKRRCVVLNLDLPADEEELKTRLLERGQCHFSDDVDEKTMKTAADMLIAERRKAKAVGEPFAGQAEYLDMLRALANLTKNATDRTAEQNQLLGRIRNYVFIKSPAT